MIKKLLLSIAAFGILSTSAQAWELELDSGTSGSPYNAFQIWIESYGTVDFETYGWNVVNTVAGNGGQWIVAIGPDAGWVGDIEIEGWGDKKVIFQKWYVDASWNATLKKNYYLDKWYNLGDSYLGDGWWVTDIGNAFNEFKAPSHGSHSVPDGGMTLVLLGFALVGMALASRFVQRSH